MTLHAFTEYLNYKWKAKGRHGTHSPFVYALVEDVLLNDKQDSNRTVLSFPQLDPYYQELLQRIAGYYHYQSVLSLPGNGGSGQLYDILLIDAADANLLGQYVNKIQKDGMVVVANIHNSSAHTATWQSVYSNKEVRMSIDLYGIGLLFFKEEFKEKQHFVLQHKGLS